MFRIHVDGLDQLQRRFGRLPAEVVRIMTAAMGGAVEIVRGGVAKYPKATAANKPPGLNGYSWYERGFGTRTVTGKGYPTSETLGKSWTTKVTPISGGVRGTIGTRASYAPFVQDKTRQAQFHTARGWLTVQEVLEKNAERIAKLFQAALRRVMGK